MIGNWIARIVRFGSTIMVRRLRRSTPAARNVGRRSAAEWSGRLAAAGLLQERVNTYADFLRHPHVDAMGAVAWVEQPGVPEPVPVPNLPGLPALLDGTPRAASPTLGQHTEQILRELGFAAGDIATLVESKAVRVRG